MGEETRLYRDVAGKLVAESRFRVRYFETDAMAIVHHAAYITWFEEARSAFTRAIGYPYARMESEGLLLAVAEVRARYHKPARYDEEVLVTACLAEFPSRGMTFDYEVRRSTDGTLLVSGSTRHVSVDSSGRVCRIPEAVRSQITLSAAAATLG
jgi:acyl-CoA thioester hydrolase